MNECVRCGSERTVPVWENLENAHESTPDYVGCKNCSTMVRPHLVPEDDEPSYGQVELTDRELRKLPVGNQHSRDLSVIEWQIVKAAAGYYGVTDWISKADSQLTYEENVGLMERLGTENNETSLRMLKSPREYKGPS